jgi:hypothetical protein
MSMEGDYFIYCANKTGSFISNGRSFMITPVYLSYISYNFDKLLTNKNNVLWGTILTNFIHNPIFGDLLAICCELAKSPPQIYFNYR